MVEMRGGGCSIRSIRYIAARMFQERDPQVPARRRSRTPLVTTNMTSRRSTSQGVVLHTHGALCSSCLQRKCYSGLEVVLWAVVVHSSSGECEVQSTLCHWPGLTFSAGNRIAPNDGGQVRPAMTYQTGPFRRNGGHEPTRILEAPGRTMDRDMPCCPLSLRLFSTNHSNPSCPCSVSAAASCWSKIPCSHACDGITTPIPVQLSQHPEIHEIHKPLG